MNEISDKSFQNELQKLETLDQAIQDPAISNGDLRMKCKDMLNISQQLVKQTIKIINIGDLHQKKLYDANIEIEAQKKQFYFLSIMDKATGIYNRSYIMDFLAKEFEKSKRYKNQLSCILIDIDDFKKINDTYGHMHGDRVLRDVAKSIEKTIRKTDEVGRYGGEEFLVILPNTDISQISAVAEKIRKNIADMFIEFDDIACNVTVSLGCADMKTGSPQTEDELLHNSDVSLYKAKDLGKNKAVFFNELFS